MSVQAATCVHDRERHIIYNVCLYLYGRASTSAAFPFEGVHPGTDNKAECVSVSPKGVSDSLRERGGKLIHTDGEIRVKHGRCCHCSLTPENGKLPNVDSAVVVGRQGCSEDEQSCRAA